MMAPQEARKLLKVSENATMQEMADAFRHVASLAHPDHGGSATAFRRCLTALRLASRGPASEASKAAITKRPSAHASPLFTALRRLEMALRGLERSQRKEALEQLPTQVRFALHSHMEAGTFKACTSSLDTGALTGGTGSCLERRRVAGRYFYRVRQGLGLVEARTQYVASLDAALHFLGILVQLRSLLRSESDDGDGQTVGIYCDAFHRGLAVADCQQLHLAFRATVRCCAVKLEGPYTSQLHIALEQSGLLHSAAQHGGWAQMHRALQQLRPGVPAVQQVSSAQLRGQVHRAQRAVEKALKVQKVHLKRSPKRRERRVKRAAGEAGEAVVWGMTDFYGR